MGKQAAAEPSTVHEAQGTPARAPLDDEAPRQRVEALFQVHAAFLRKLAMRLCGSTFDSDDLVQDTLERTVQHHAALASVVDHRAWMARVMRNLFFDRLRRRAAAPESLPLEPELAAPPAETREWWEGLDANDVRATLDALPEDLREAFELFTFQRWSYTAIAQHLAITRTTVGTRILRARRRLKQLLQASHGRGGDDD